MWYSAGHNFRKSDVWNSCSKDWRKFHLSCYRRNHWFMTSSHQLFVRQHFLTCRVLCKYSLKTAEISWTQDKGNRGRQYDMPYNFYSVRKFCQHNFGKTCVEKREWSDDPDFLKVRESIQLTCSKGRTIRKVIGGRGWWKSPKNHARYVIRQKKKKACKEGKVMQLQKKKFCTSNGCIWKKKYIKTAYSPYRERFSISLWLDHFRRESSKWVTVIRKAVVWQPVRQLPVAKCVCFVIFHTINSWYEFTFQWAIALLLGTAFDLFRKKISWVMLSCFQCLHHTFMFQFLSSPFNLFSFYVLSTSTVLSCDHLLGKILRRLKMKC